MNKTKRMELSESEMLLVEKLREHPQIKEHVSGLLAEIDDDLGRLESADDAEDALVNRMRELGRQSLSQWAQNKARRAEESPPEAGARRECKKN